MVELLNYYLEKHSKEIKSLTHVGAHYGQEINYYQTFDFDDIYLFEPLKSA